MSLTKVSYSMISGAPVNVLDYGATGNGSTDDTVAIQAAASAATNRVLYVPAGTYRLTSVITIPVTTSIQGEGIGKTNFVQATANTGAFKTASASLAYLQWNGFTVTGAGYGTGTSIGVLMGETTYGTNYCQLHNIEVTNFGAANLRLVNGFRCSIEEVFVHGSDTGALTAATIGLHLLGTYAFAGSNYDNRIGYVEAYNNVTDVKVENGGKNSFYKQVYCYSQSFTGTLHHIHEVNSSLNSWHRTHIEPLSLSAGGTAMWMIESTATNPYTDMLGPFRFDIEYDNGTLGTTTNVIQVGTAAGSTVYKTTILEGNFMPISAGKFHAVLTNEKSTRIAHNAARNNNLPFDNIVRELTISNPNAATNGSYIGSWFEESYGTWTPQVFAGASVTPLFTLTPTTSRWIRNGKLLNIILEVALSAKTADTGDVYFSGANTITPINSDAIFTAAPTINSIASSFVFGLGTAAVSAFSVSTGKIEFYNLAGTKLTETSFDNGDSVLIDFAFQLA